MQMVGWKDIETAGLWVINSVEWMELFLVEMMDIQKVPQMAPKKVVWKDKDTVEHSEVLMGSLMVA